jgi:hypothetical protein
MALVLDMVMRARRDMPATSNYEPPPSAIKDTLPCPGIVEVRHAISAVILACSVTSQSYHSREAHANLNSTLGNSLAI